MRVVVLMIEVEQPEGLSARKLVLETAKHNVLTAYNGLQGIELLRRFPNVDATVVHRELRDMPVKQVIAQIKELNPKMPIVLLSPFKEAAPEGADYVISSHEPQLILMLFESVFGASTMND
jgi:response regulator RpfG family c-di-GMP phosphodiesterase